MTQSSAPAGNRFAFSSVTLLFFMWGFITCMNDLLCAKFKADFGLLQWQANLVQSAFFGAYFIFSLIYFLISAAKGDPINKIGYKNGLVAGLVVAGLGCFLFYPAAISRSYPMFLGALIVLGAGVTLIQIAANPFVTILGPEESAPSRLNLSQGLNSLGYVIAPAIGGLLLFGKEAAFDDKVGGVAAVKIPYLGLGVAFMVLAVAFFLIRLPDFKQAGAAKPTASAFRHPHFFWGWLAIFFYVGSEATVGNIMINYLQEVLHLPEKDVTHYLSFYWGGLMIGRLMGAISLSNLASARKYIFMALAAAGSVAIIYLTAAFKESATNHGATIPFASILPFIGLVVLNFIFFIIGRSQPGRMVGLFSIVAGVLTVLAMPSYGNFALWSIVGIGLFNSIMWSNIFSLSIRGLGSAKSQGSSLLVMMIVGGAVLPLVQGLLMDKLHSVHQSLGIVLVGYAYLAYFGFFGSKSKRPLTEDEADRSMVGGH